MIEDVLNKFVVISFLGCVVLSITVGMAITNCSVNLTEKTPDIEICDAGVDVETDVVEDKLGYEDDNAIGGLPNDKPSCGCPPGQNPKPR